MNPYTQLTGHDTQTGFGWETMVSEAAYKVVTVIESLFSRR